MTGNEFQQAALRTMKSMNAPYGDLIIGSLGMCGESGEVADHVKKFLGQGHELNPEHLLEECGDVLWYVAITLNSLGYDMDTCMEYNKEKLNKRYPNGFDPERSIHREDETHVQS